MTTTALRSIPEIEKEIHNTEVYLDVMSEGDSLFEKECIDLMNKKLTALYAQLVAAERLAYNC